MQELFWIFFLINIGGYMLKEVNLLEEIYKVN